TVEAEGSDAAAAASAPTSAPAAAPAASVPAAAAPAVPAVTDTGFNKAHASPSIRAFARQLGIDLAKINGSGRKGRILRDDVTAAL
ncbi:branched-chain alpha-keto acid dehydrogenase subunit E2, partial [Salmonella enterica subsp. enterica serovar Typhimurium]|uniref:E3 binding domain-containing protein n=2 Tax=Pseudomonadota TaxID=1224 RepID=UPI0015CBEE75